MKELFMGKDRMLLQDYFDFKVKLAELKNQQRYRYNEETDREIKEIEKNIVEIISMYGIQQLREIIFMSLDIEYRG